MRNKKRTIQMVESGAQKATRWIGSTASLITHTVIFIFFAILVILGVDFDKVLLFLTTIVSLEAIYLSIFIQMSVNRQSSQLDMVSEDIEDISEDIEEIQKDVEGIEEDIDEIQEDVSGIEEDIEEIQEDVEGIEKDIDEIQEDVEGLEENIEEMSDDMDEDDRNDEARDKEMLTKIEGALAVIMQEIAILKTENKAKTAKSKSKTKTIQDLKKSNATKNK